VSTDANGSAELQTPYGKNVSAVTVSVASGGKSTNLRLVTGGSPYYGSPPNYSSYGFSARVVSDTASIHPGDTATIVVHLEVNGTPMYARRVTQIVYPSERPGAIVAGNVTTSPTGNFTVTYPIPSDWTPADSLNILVQAPEGEQLLNVQFGASQLRLSPRLPLTAAFDAANRRIALSANFTGSETLSGASLLVMLVPGADRYSFLSSVDGKPLFAALARTGSSFSGVLEVPSWMPLGNYTVFARLSNGGATTSAWDIVDAFNATVVQVKEAPPKTETKGVLPGFVPGFEAAFALGAIAAAAAWTGLATEHKIDRRSRRKARNP
jgi:hypothetical protein